MERFIEKAVMSAVEQSDISLRALEILVINDGSEDGTGHIVKKHGGFIRLISLAANAGVLTANMKALKEAEGDQINGGILKNAPNCPLTRGSPFSKSGFG